MLAAEGYEVRKAWWPISADVVQEIAAIKTEPIFNDNPDHTTDRKRRQAPVATAWSRLVRRRLSAEFAPLRSSSMVVIESLPGCQRQAAHCDYIPTEELLALEDAEMPLLFLLAIEPGTTIDLWPRSHHLLRSSGVKAKVPCHRVTVALEPGDAILFRADLVHAGSAYAAVNRRVHVYLDNPEHHRDPNRTWIIYKHAPRPLRALIDETELP